MVFLNHYTIVITKVFQSSDTYHMYMKLNNRSCVACRLGYLLLNARSTNFTCATVYHSYYILNHFIVSLRYPKHNT